MKIFQLLLNKLKSTKSKISFHKAEDLMKELGFLSKNKQRDENEEKVLFVDFWGCLHGDSDKHGKLEPICYSYQ